MPLFRRKEKVKKEERKIPKVKKIKEAASKKKKEISPKSRAFQTLRQPQITEKGTSLGTLNKYVFEVDRKANKTAVKRAVEEVYGVKVLKVNIINFLGKKRKYGQSLGRTRAWKKAVVTLREGDTIELFKGV